jgi:GT2 family glycosyltransferase
MGPSDLTVLIASRNRSNKLFKLLMSIDQNSIFPGQVVVISSGEYVDVSKLEFWKFNLVHRHVDFSGQVRQKTFGLDFISEKTKWVLFLDDDVFLEKDFFAKLSVLNFDSSVLGFGLNHNIYHRGSFINLFHGVLNKKKLGKVTRSGHGIGYVGSSSNIEIKWANGLSIWSTSIINLYRLSLPSNYHDALEDIIFSHKVSKYGRILFLQDIWVFSQQSEELPLTFRNYISSVYWRYYFVKLNSEFSLSYMLGYEFLRAVNFILIGDRSINFFLRFTKTFFNLVELSLYVILNKDPKKIMVSKNLI